MLELTYSSHVSCEQMTSIASQITQRREAQAEASASVSFFLLRNNDQEVQLASVTQWSSFFEGVEEDEVRYLNTSA